MQPILKTNLFNKANLSLTQAKPLFMFLEEKGYLERIEDPGLTSGRGKERKTKFLYLTTRKGREALGILKCPPLRELFEIHEWLREQKEAEG